MSGPRERERTLVAIQVPAQGAFQECRNAETTLSVIPANGAFQECRNAKTPLSVIPANAGIQGFADVRKFLQGMDSRLRGNDGKGALFLNRVAGFERPRPFWKAANAGIQRFARMRKSLASLDSRLRGNDGEEVSSLELCSRL